MRAVILESYGGPEVNVVREVPDPTPGPEEVLVEVRSSALNRADLLQRAGLYPSPPLPGYADGAAHRERCPVSNSPARSAPSARG